MSTAALAHDALLPRAPGGNGPGLVLALAVHAALLLALTTAVDWRTKTPEVASAELWASVPQSAAPPPPAARPALPAPTLPAPPPTRTPAPPPAPPPIAPRPAEPDIATERAERRKAEAARRRDEEEKAQRVVAEKKQRAADEARKQREQQQQQQQRDLLARQKVEAEKAAQAEKAEKAEKAEAERLARQRDENLRRIMAQAGTGTTAGANAQTAGPSASYTGRLVALVRGNLVYTGVISDNAPAEVEVTATASGTVLSRRLLKSSGHKDWDDAVLRAIDRTTTLPRDTDGRVPTPIIIAFRPRD